MSYVWEFWNPNLVINTLKKNAKGKMEKACKYLVDEIKKDMRSSKSGRTYYLKFIGKHIAAADGESPAVRYGNLINAVEYKITEVGDQLIGMIGVNLDKDEIGYAYFLEMGFRVGGKIYIKPYIRRITFEQSGEIKRMLS